MPSDINNPGAAACFPNVLRTALLGWEESRPVVQVMFTGRFLAAALLSGGAGRHAREVAAGAAVWLAAGIAVYVFNGVMDVTEDRGNGSTRPIASGRLAAGSAIRFVAGSAALALAAGACVRIFDQVALFLVLGYLYSGPPWPAKRSGVTAVIVTVGLGAVTFWAGARAGGAGTAAVVVFGAVMSAWIGLVGALVKDVGDATGDALAGRRTFAVVYGAERVRRCAAAFALALGAAGTLAAWRYAPLVLPAMLTLTAGAAWTAGCCVRPGTGGGRISARRPYRAFMAAQYATTAVAISTVLVLHA